MVADSHGHQILATFEPAISQRRVIGVCLPESVVLDGEALNVGGQVSEQLPEPRSRPGLSLRIWPVFKPPLFAVFLRFRNQEVELAAACVPIQFRIPTFLLEGVNTLGDPGKLVELSS